MSRLGLQYAGTIRKGKTVGRVVLRFAGEGEVRKERLDGVAGQLSGRSEDRMKGASSSLGSRSAIESSGSSSVGPSRYKGQNKRKARQPRYRKRDLVLRLSREKARGKGESLELGHDISRQHDPCSH